MPDENILTGDGVVETKYLYVYTYVCQYIEIGFFFLPSYIPNYVLQPIVKTRTIFSVGWN